MLLCSRLPHFMSSRFPCRVFILIVLLFFSWFVAGFYVSRPLLIVIFRSLQIHPALKTRAFLDIASCSVEVLAGCCECGDEPSGSCATELVSKYTNVSEVRTASIIRAIKCFYTSTGLHGAISQKAVILILAALRTRNLTQL
jgi:hypothetical protein